jgi:glycosyltransferase involved in cell wall biosynthesis
VNATAAGPVRVIQHERRPRRTGNFSIERAFAALRAAIAEAPDVAMHVEPHVAPCESRGLWPRWRNLRDAARVQADVHHLLGDNGYLAAALPPSRTILTVHDCIPDEVGAPATRSLRRWGWIIAPARRAARVVAVSEFTRREVLRLTGIPPERVSVIPTVVPALHAPPPRPFPARPRLLQLGTAPNKNIERLAAALAGLSVDLLVVGPLSAPQRAAIAAAGVACEQHDALSEAALADAYARSDLVTVVSTLEGFGMPVVEAQRLRRPVIAARASALPETAGDGAAFADPFDVASIRDAVRRCCDDAVFRHALVEAGLRNAARFSAHAAAMAYVALYREVANAAE